MFDYVFTNSSGTRCWIAGWGQTPDSAKSTSTILKKVDVPLEPSNEVCESLIHVERTRTRNGREPSLFPVLDGEICAGGEEGKDACNGDGGAPLVCQAGHRGRWYVVGLVNWGVGCGRADVPGVYTRVAHYRSWINGRK